MSQWEILTTNGKYQDIQDLKKIKLKATIGGDSLFILLPQPITCFAAAIYKQHQSFYLRGSGSLLLLEW
jgi:urease accessory protein UreH